MEINVDSDDSPIPVGASSVIVRDKSPGKTAMTAVADPAQRGYDTRIVDVADADAESINLVERGIRENSLELVGIVN